MVLGISLGTRSFGYAVFKEEELFDWGLKTCKGKWSTKKLKKIHQVISEVITVNDITEVAVKVPDTIPTSKGFTQLMGSLNILFQDLVVTSRFLTLADLKQHYCDSGNVNKEVLSEAISRKYPELSIAYLHTSRERTGYYMKVFEAVAAASFIETHAQR